MIGAILARFAFGRVINTTAAKVPWQIWAAAGVVAVLGVGGVIINNRAYDRGYAASDAAWVVIVNEEIGRQIGANVAALAAAEQNVAALRQAKEVRDATIERLQQEAENDPDAGRVAIGVDGVRRIDSLSD